MVSHRTQTAVCWSTHPSSPPPPHVGLLGPNATLPDIITSATKGRHQRKRMTFYRSSAIDQYCHFSGEDAAITAKWHVDSQQLIGSIVKTRCLFNCVNVLNANTAWVRVRWQADREHPGLSRRAWRMLRVCTPYQARWVGLSSSCWRPSGSHSHWRCRGLVLPKGTLLIIAERRHVSFTLSVRVFSAGSEMQTIVRLQVLRCSH